jgi:hypothetical protein
VNDQKVEASTLQTMVGHIGGEEARNHGQIAINGEEDESGQNIRNGDDVEEVENIGLFPCKVVNANIGKSPTPSISGGTSYKRSNERKVNF